MENLIGFCNNKFIQIYFATRTYGFFFSFSYKSMTAFVIVLRHHKFQVNSTTDPVELPSSIIPTGRICHLQNYHFSG